MGGGASTNRGTTTQVIWDPRPTAVVADQGLTIAGSSINGRQGGALTNSTLKLLVNPRQTASSAQLTRRTEGSFQASTKLFVRPSIPFQFKFQGRDVRASSFALYHPCPVRVENIQYDAVLSWNDPSSPGNDTCILIPLRSRLRSERGEFISRIAQHIPTMLRSRQEQQNGRNVTVFDPVNISTGTSWDMSRMFSTGPNSAGETEILDPYFTWNAGEWESYVVSDNGRTRRMGWRQANGRNYIMMKDPIDISPADMSYISSLPTTEASGALPPIGVFSYQPGRVAERPGCRATANDKSPAGMLKAQQEKQKEQASQVMYAVNSVFLLVGLVALIWVGIQLAKWIGPSVQAGAGWLAGQFSRRVAEASVKPDTPTLPLTESVSLEDIVPETVNPMLQSNYVVPTTPIEQVNPRVRNSLQGYNARRQSPRRIPPSPPPVPNVSRPITPQEMANAAGTGLVPLPVPAKPPRPPPLDTRPKRRLILPTPPSSPKAT